MRKTTVYLQKFPGALRPRAGVLTGVAALVLTVCVVAATWFASAAATDGGGYRLAKATILDCTASTEEDSSVDTSAALLEALSFAQGNPFYLDMRAALTSDLPCALSTDKWVEKAEWTYDEAGRVKTSTFYKSTAELSRIALSYDAHGSVSKAAGWTYFDAGDGRGAVRHDFEATNVSEMLSSEAYGVNKTTVVHADAGTNDTVLYTYDKDHNLADVVSKGAHDYRIQATYSTAFKYPMQLKASRGGADEGALLVPTYDASNKLVSLRTGTWAGGQTTLSGEEYEVQYSKGRYSKVNCYQDDAQVKYYDFSYDDQGNLATLRAYRKGGVQLYCVTFYYEST